MSRPAKGVFFDLSETLVTQNIEDNMVTRNALREISPILPKRVSSERMFELYHEGYKINETIRSRHHVEIPIQVWMRQLLERIIGDNPSDQLVNRAIEVIVKARAANAIAFDDAHSTIQKLSRGDVKLGIIRYSLMRFKARPEEAVMVGDSEIHDVGGGYISGLKTVLVDRRHCVENSLADYHFNSLRDASRKLESL